MIYLIAGLSGLLGLGVGSFLNVVIWRLPQGLSVVSPPSACPSCGSRLKPWHNVPVVSWLLLRRKCAFCSTPISARYPLVELLTGVMYAGAVLMVGIQWVLPALWYFLAVGIALTFIDIDLKILPDRIVLPSYLIMLLLLSLASYSPAGASDWGSLGRAAIGAFSLLLLYGLAWWFYPRGMGFGDVKLSGVIGLTLGWFGWGSLAIGAFAGFLFGGIGGAIVLSLKGKGRKQTIPFGPWMILGAVFGIALGEQIWQVYIDTFL